MNNDLPEDKNRTNRQQELKLPWAKPECTKLDVKNTQGGNGTDDEFGDSKSGS